MPALDKIAYYQNRRDEVPNQELARELAEQEDRAGIGEIAENLWNQEPNVQSDCLKVLYEIGYLKPELIAGYWQDFIKLLGSKNNRLVWGAMIALSTISQLKPDELFTEIETIRKAVNSGSVITIDAGILTLAKIAAHSPGYNQAIFPFLLQHLEGCRTKDVPRHAEMIQIAVSGSQKDAFTNVLESRLPEMTPAQGKRVKSVLSVVQKK